MRRLSLIVCLVAFAGCKSAETYDVENPITACRSFATAACNRLSQCEDGVDVDSCVQLLVAANNCNAANCTPDVYSPTAAQQCLDDLNAQSCFDSENNTQLPSCQPSAICIIPG